MSQFSGNFPDARTDGQTDAQGSIYRTLPPKEVGPKTIFEKGVKNKKVSKQSGFSLLEIPLDGTLENGLLNPHFVE